MPRRLNTLDLVGDGDDVEIIADIERLFSIKIEDHEAAATRTVGDLHDLVRRKRSLPAAPTTACFSRIAFHRIGRASRDLGLASEIRPSTPIAELIAGDKAADVRERWRALERRSGLAFPDLCAPGSDKPATKPGCAKTLAFCAVTVATLAALGPLAFVLAIGVAVAYARYDYVRRTVPARIVTVGDLCEEAAGRSFGALFADKRSCHPNDVWFAVVSACRGASGFRDPIDRDTTFFASDARAH